MRRIVTRFIAACFSSAMLYAFACSAGAQPLSDSGTWTLHGTGPVVFEVRLVTATGNSEYGSDVPLESLRGLSPDALASSGADVRFDLARDAGLLHCTGHVASGHGGGTFRFVLNGDYPRQLAALGIGLPTSDEQRRMALEDVSLAYVRKFRDNHVTVHASSELLHLVEHGATVRFITGLGSLGYRITSVADLVRLVDHGVALETVRHFQELGFHPSADDLVRLVDHGVTPDFAHELASLGYRATVDQLVDLVDHGVTAAFARKMAKHEPKPGLDDLIRLRDAGI